VGGVVEDVDVELVNSAYNVQIYMLRASRIRPL